MKNFKEINRTFTVKKNSIFNAVCKTRYLALLVVLIFTCRNVWGADLTTSSDPAPAGTYTAMVSGEAVVAGDTIIIVCETSGKAMSTTQNSNNRGSVSVTISNSSPKTVTLNGTTTAQALSVAASANSGWTLYTGVGYLYAPNYNSGTGNYLRTDNTGKDGSGGNWTIEYNSVVAAGSGSRRYIRRNGDLISCYSSGSQTEIQVYKKAHSVTYKGNGGTTSCSHASLFKSNETVTICATEPTRAGYNFTGWTANVDLVNASTSATIAAGTLIDGGTTIKMPAKHVVFTAQWESAAPTGYCISAFNSSNDGITSGFSNGGSGNEYTLNYTIPGKDGSSNWPQYWIGENGAWAASFSANALFANMPLVSATSATLGLAEGATGKLHIWDDNKASGSNLWVKFEPDGYGLRWGGTGEWDQAANTKAFTVDPGNANTYWTEIVTLDGTNNTSWNYYVGLQSASGYVYSGVDNEGSDNRGVSRTRSVTTMKVSNGTAGQYKATYLNSEATGTRGKFRIWDNNISDYNFVCHFVPYYRVTYNGNGASGSTAASADVSCEGDASARTVKAAANGFTPPAHHAFGGWATSASGTKVYDPNDDIVLTADVELFAIWTEDAKATITLNNYSGAPAPTDKYVGETWNLPSTNSYSCNDKTFVGWSTVEINTPQDTKPSSNFYEPGAEVTLAATNTFYAVFAEVSGELSNSYAAITSGLETANYVIAYSYNNGTQIVLQNTADNSSPSDKLEGYNLSLSDSKYSNPAASYIWELRAQSDGSYYIYNTAVEKYVNATITPELTLSTTPTKFTITYDDTNSRWTIQIKESTSYYIHGYVNSTAYDFRCSTSGSGARYRIYLYKQESNITYAKYSTTCSTDPELSVTPTELDFGNVANGTYKEMTFSLSGTHLTANASIAVSGTNSSYFTVTPNSVDKGSGTISATNITVRYTPGAVGDGHTATVTVTSGEAEPKTVTLTGNCKATYSVSVSPTPTNGTVTADKTSGILAGETVTLTIAPNSGYVLSSITANSGAVTLDGTGNTRTFTMPTGDVTIAATFIERVDFVLVKDVNDLYEGATVVFCNKGEVEQYARVIGAYADGNNWPAVSASVFEENDQLKILTTTPNMQTLTLGDGTVDNTWSFSDGTGYIYAASSSSNYMKRQATLNANGSFTIAINSTTGEATLTAQGANTRNTMSYNTDGFFSCYASNNTQSPMYIYMIPSNCDKLLAPTGLSVSNITQNSATLSWNAVDHASGYNVSCSGGTVEYTSGTSATVTGLTQGTAYTWSVQATGTGEYCALGLKANGNFTTKRAVKVTYNSNGSTGGQLPVAGGVVNLTEGDSHTILGNTGSGGSPSPLVKSGYTFDGWHNSSTYSATPAYTIGNTITVNENIVIYANWRPQQDTFFDDMHQTTGYTSGGHIESGNYTMPGPLSNVASGNACETSHYIFVGWVILGGQNPDGTINGSPKIWRAGESNNASGATYYAVWAEE